MIRLEATLAVLLVASLLLAGAFARVNAAERGAASEMKDMRLIEGGVFQMGDVFDEGVQFATPVHEVNV
jgi:hypothetical protein